MNMKKLAETSKEFNLKLTEKEAKLLGMTPEEHEK
jgi:hypothetical protein